MAINYSLSKLLARQQARSLSREQALAEMQAEQARIGQVTGAIGALTQAGLAAGGAAQQIGQQAGEADALSLLPPPPAKPKAPPVEEPKTPEAMAPPGDKPPEPAAQPVAAAPATGGELKALLEKQRTGMSGIIDPVVEPVRVHDPAAMVKATADLLLDASAAAFPSRKVDTVELVIESDADGLAFGLKPSEVDRRRKHGVIAAQRFLHGTRGNA